MKRWMNLMATQSPLSYDESRDIPRDLTRDLPRADDLDHRMRSLMNPFKTSNFPLFSAY